jgi:ankyrin repeat protein
MDVQTSLDKQLLAAAAEGNTVKVQQLLKRGASPHATHGPDKRTALHAAAEAGHVKVVNVLFNSTKAAAAAVDARTTKGRTPLHLAARRGHGSVAKALLTWRASVFAADNDGCTPLHHAATRGPQPS